MIRKVIKILIIIINIKTVYQEVSIGDVIDKCPLTGGPDLKSCFGIFSSGSHFATYNQFLAKVWSNQKIYLDEWKDNNKSGEIYNNLKNGYILDLDNPLHYLAVKTSTSRPVRHNFNNLLKNVYDLTVVLKAIEDTNRVLTFPYGIEYYAPAIPEGTELVKVNWDSHLILTSNIRTLSNIAWNATKHIDHIWDIVNTTQSEIEQLRQKVESVEDSINSFLTFEPKEESTTTTESVTKQTTASTTTGNPSEETTYPSDTETTIKTTSDDVPPEITESTQPSSTPTSEHTTSNKPNHKNTLYEQIEKLYNINIESLKTDLDQKYLVEIQRLEAKIKKCNCDLLGPDSAYITQGITLISAVISLFSFSIGIYSIYGNNKKGKKKDSETATINTIAIERYNPSAPAQEEIQLLEPKRRKVRIEQKKS